MGANAFAHKGGMHVAGINRDARTFEHIDPADVGADRARAGLRAVRQGHGRRRRADVDDATAARVIDRVKELEHRGYQFEAADGSFDLLIRKETGDYEPLFRLESWRAIVEKRADGRVETEATIKIWVDGERYVRTAEGNGPVHALDKALREAIGERYPHLRDIQLVNFKVRILDETKGTGAVTRVLLDASDGTDNWGAIGVSENIIEASWEALVDSLEAGMLPGRAAARATAQLASALTHDVIPLAQAAHRRARGGAGAGDAALGAARARAAARRVRGRACAACSGAPASAVSSGTAGLHLAIRAAGIEAGDEVVTTPFSFVASANCLLYEDARAGVLRHRPAHAQHRSRRRGRPRSPTARPGCCPCTSSATPPTCRRSSALAPTRGLWIVEDACEALGAAHADGRDRRRRAATRRCSASTRTSRSRPARAARWSAPTPPSRSASTPSATRAARPTWAGSTTTGSGFNYRLDDLSCALGIAQLERLDELLAGPRARGGALLRGAGRTSRASSCPAPTRTATGAPGSSTWCSCRTASTATPRSTAMRERGVDTKPYLPAIHLMSFYRERFGHREGEFPVCEDVARRSLALPFFGELHGRRGGAGGGGAARR